MPPDVDACVTALLRDNPDLSEEQASGVCNSMKNRGVLGEYLNNQTTDGIVSLGGDRNLPIEEQDDRLLVRVADADNFEQLKPPTPLDPDRGVLARFGSPQGGGQQQLVELHFLTTGEGNDWTTGQVQSFLGDQGFDDASPAGAELLSGDWRYAHEHHTLSGADNVQEEDGRWVIEDSVLTQSGVYNGLLREEDVFREVFELYEGIPVTHGHPEDIVKEQAEVAGRIENVRVEEVSGQEVHDVEAEALEGTEAETEVRVIGDYVLPKEAGQEGLSITEAQVERNEETVRRVRDGETVDNSQGYLFHVEESTGQHAGKEFDGRMTELVPNHEAILLDSEGACNWQDGCGVARLNAEGVTPNPPDEDSTPMPCNCGLEEELEELKAEREKLQTRVNTYQESLKTLGNVLGVEAEDGELSPDMVVSEARDITDRLTNLEEQVQEQKRQVAEECADLALEVGREGDKEDLVEDYMGRDRRSLQELHTLLTAQAKNAGQESSPDGVIPTKGQDDGDEDPADDTRKALGLDNDEGVTYGKPDEPSWGSN